MTAPEITVLHVEDDEAFRDVTRQFIQTTADDISIISVSSPVEALDRLDADDSIDCVLSDYEMPDVTGLEFLESVRERWPTLPFILFTGRGDEETAMNAIKLGVTDYLQKKSGVSQYALLINRIRNVVTQHRAEAALKRQSQQTETQLDLLVNTVEEYAIFLLDADGRVQTWNRGAENIKGYTADEILGRHFSIFYPEEAVEAGVPEQNLQKAAAEGTFTEEGWRLRKEGSEFWADVTITALYEDDELVGYAKVTRDNTRQREEQLLVEQNERLQHLIAALSHDLKSPLTAVDASIELAISSGDVSNLQQGKDALHRASSLLRYLEQVATERRQLIRPKPVSLREAAEESWAILATDGAELRIEDDVEILADRNAFHQLIENLLSNAVRYGGPEATVRLGRLDDGFYVEDDGPGIPEDERGLVFEIGHSSSGSSGFGLPICRYIVDAHGWFIDITEGSDGGARFEITGIEFVMDR